MYWHFIQQRYYSGSGYTRTLVGQWKQRIESFLVGKPPILRTIYEKVKWVLEVARTHHPMGI